MHLEKDPSIFYKATSSLSVYRKVFNKYQLFITIIVPNINNKAGNNVIYTLELKLETLGNYSFDANRKQTFDCSAKKYLFEPFLQNPPTFNQNDESDSIEAYRDYEMPIGWCFCSSFMTLKTLQFFPFYFWGVANNQGKSER